MYYLAEIIEFGQLWGLIGIMGPYILVELPQSYFLKRPKLLKSGTVN